MEARRELVRSLFGPAVVVIASPDADAVCKKNNLSLVQMLQPFACSRFTPRTGGHLEMFVRFMQLGDLDPPSAREANRAMADAVSDVYFDLLDLASEAKRPFQIEPTVWFDAYRRAFFKQIGPSDHEFFNHPVACIAAVSTAHDNPLQALSSLYSMSEPPAVFEKQRIDPTIRKYHVLIHDNANGGSERAESLLQQGKGLFGDQLCSLLVINSNEDPDGDSMIVPDLWTDLVGPLNPRKSAAAQPQQDPPESSGDATAAAPEAEAATMFDPLSQPMADTEAPEHPVARRYGAHLAEKDLSSIRRWVDEFASGCLYHYLQETVYRLNTHVASNRKGLSRSLFSATKKFFGSGSSGSSKTASPVGSPQGKAAAAYAFNSQELQMRRLGDYAFMLQDYELAYTTYHSVKKDFNADKAWKHLAGTQEMLGLCLFMQDKRQNEDNHRFESAIMTYLSKCSAAANASVYACRTTLMATEMMLSKNLYREAATSFIRMTGEDSDLRSALFLEQAAVCFQQCSPSMPRRAAFHLILAGHRYTKCNMRVHSLRCYVQALRLYNGLDWDLAEEHIYYTVGRQAYQLGLVEQALVAFSKLLCSDKQLLAQQKLHLKEYLGVFKQLGGSQDGQDGQEPREVPIPTIEPGSIQVLLRPDVASEQQGTDAARKMPETGWRDMEQRLLHALKRPVTRTRSNSVHCLDDHTDNSVQPVCVVGEPIRVQLKLTNPLHVPLELRHVKLRCRGSESETTDGEVLADLSAGDDEQVFSVDELPSLVLKERQTSQVELAVTPCKEGSLRISGLQFSFHGVQGFRPFVVRGKRLNSNRKQKLGRFYAKDQRLHPIITRAMPLLNVHLTGLEKPFYSSQLVSAMMIIQNNGASPLVGLHAACMPSGRLIVGTHKDMNSTLYPAQDADGDDANTEAALNAVPSGQARSVVKLKFNESGKLDVGCKAAVPVWFWAGSQGAQDIHLLFHYTAEDPSSRLPYRMLRHSVRCKVLPSLVATASVHRFPHEFDNLFLRVAAGNVHNSARLRLRQLSCRSNGWAIRGLCTPPGEPIGSSQLTLNPKEATALHVRLERCSSVVGDSEANDGDDGAHRLSSICFDRASAGGTVVTQQPAGSFFSRAVAKDNEKTQQLRGDRLQLLLLWDAPQGGEAGQAFISQPVASTLGGEGRIHDNHNADIHFILRHEDQLTHDFATEPLLKVAASLVLRNYSVGEQNVCVELLPPWAKTADSHSPSPFLWVGKTTFRFKLAESGTMELPLAASVTSPGILDLSRLRVSLPDSPDVAVRTPWHSHMCIEASDA
eukprot:m.50250 g.50250  ORF g.50250 m.50250 type:complete len:1293 (-) comp12141_c1_seq1:266-4144(-)